MPVWLFPLLAALPQLTPAVIQLVDEIIAVFNNNPPTPVAPAIMTDLHALRANLTTLHAAHVKRGLVKP